MIITGVLTREQEAAGLTLKESEDFLALEDRGRTVAVWSVAGSPDAAAVRREAAAYLEGRGGEAS